MRLYRLTDNGAEVPGTYTLGALMAMYAVVPPGVFAAIDAMSADDVVTHGPLSVFVAQDSYARAELEAHEANAQAAQLLGTIAEQAAQIAALVLALHEWTAALDEIDGWTGKQNGVELQLRVRNAEVRAREVLKGFASVIAQAKAEGS